MKKIQILCLTIIMFSTTTFINAQISGTGTTIPNVPASNLIGIGTTNPFGAALHLFTGTNPGMLPPAIKLDRNDGTNQAGLLSIGISGNGFATGLGGGSAYFKLEDPYGNSANSDMGFSTNANAAQLVIKHSGNVGIGTSLPSAALHLFTGSNPGMLPPTFILERNDATNQAGLLTVGISGNGFAAPLGAGSAYFKLEDPFGNSPNSDMGFSTNATTAQMVIKHSGNVGMGTLTPTANLEVNSVTNGVSTAIIGKGINTGVFGEATDMNAPLTAEGIVNGYSEAIGVFGKGTYASNTGNGNIYGVAGSATAANPINNIGVYGEAKNANGYNSGVIGNVYSTNGLYNTGVGGLVTLNTSAAWSRAIAGYAPVAPNHFAGYFSGKVAIVDGSQANNFVLTSDANGLATWKDVCSLPCFATSTTTDWHTNGNATVAGDFIGTTNANPFDVYTNNTPRMTIDSNGQMGLGTATPTGAALHLLTGSNPGMLPPVIKLDRNDATNQAGLLSVGISGNGFATGLGGGSAYFKLEDPYGNSANSDMGFSTNANAAQLVIKHSGNVGIGTSLPSAALHLFTGSNPGMLPPTFILERNDLTNQAGLLTVGISSNGFAAPLGGGSAYFKLEDPFGNSPNSDMGFSTNANTAQMVIKHSGNVGMGTLTPNANLEVNSVLGTASTAIIGKGKATGVFGEARDMNVAQTELGIASGWGEAIGVFGKGTYASNTGNGNTYGVAGSAAGANPVNNVGVYGEAKNANGYNSGVLGIVSTTTGAFNTGVAGQVALNTSASWNRAIAGYAPVAPNHFAGYFDGKVAIVDGSQANNFVLTSDANGLATWKDVCTLPCFATSTTTDWHTNGNATAAGDFIGTTNANPFNVYTNNTPRMTIDSNGQMGLGTATPTGAALHLLTGSNPGMLPPAIKLDRNDATNQAGLLTIGISGNGFATGLGGGSAFFKLEDPYGNSANSDMGFSTNNVAAQLVIKHSGNVGIGTSLPLAKLDVQNGAVRIGNVTTPVGYNLYVEKGILTEKVKVAVASSLAWADYVFAPEYKLLPLSDVEKFINENKHLPNVPSTKELQKEGLDLGKMQAKQMEKIEELTLYLIEMKKEIDLLKKENTILKTQSDKN